MSIKSEILGIAAEHGYEGSAQTITGAINALTDTLAGEDVQGGRTVASAIHALSPYIGAGGGGTNAGVVLTNVDGSAAVTADDKQICMLPNMVNLNTYVIPSGYTVYVVSQQHTCSGVKFTGLDGAEVDLPYESTTLWGVPCARFAVPAIDFSEGYGPNGSPICTVRPVWS